MRKMKLEELRHLPWGGFGVQTRIRDLFLTFHFVIQVALFIFLSSLVIFIFLYSLFFPPCINSFCIH